MKENNEKVVNEFERLMNGIVDVLPEDIELLARMLVYCRPTDLSVEYRKKLDHIMANESSKSTLKELFLRFLRDEGALNMELLHSRLTELTNAIEEIRLNRCEASHAMEELEDKRHTRSHGF